MNKKHTTRIVGIVLVCVGILWLALWLLLGFAGNRPDITSFLAHFGSMLTALGVSVIATSCYMRS